MTKRQACEIEPAYVDFEFLLPLHAYALTLLSDGAFVSTLLRRVKRHADFQRREGIVFKAVSTGVAQHFARLAIDHYFEFLRSYRDEVAGRSYHNVMRLLRVTQIAWFTSSSGRKASQFKARVEELELRARNLTTSKWCDLAIDEAAPLMEEMAEACRQSRDYARMRSSYSSALSDRIIHDRQVCAHLAAALVRMAPRDRSGLPLQYVSRVRAPQWASRIVISRDRGKCACCGKDIAMELLAKPHIDHIIPLASGGCNDLVNLQLLCERCILKKADNATGIRASVPCYQGSYFIGQGYDEFLP